MVSKEFIYSYIKAHHTISVHMSGEKRMDGLTSEIYAIYELILEEGDENQLIMNCLEKVDTNENFFNFICLS